MTRIARRVGRATSMVAAVGLVLVLGAGCAAPPAPTSAPATTPRPTISPAVAATEVQLEGALRARGLGVVATDLVVRPGEPTSFAAVPRTALRAVLPQDPEGGLVVLYEFPDMAAAALGATELAAWVTSGPGRVQYPPDVRHVLRQVGSTLVFFPWSPASATDPKTADLAAAVATVGTEVPIPRG